MNHPSEETILAYIDGTVETPVKTHIRECKQCASTARRFVKAERELLNSLYRKDCPESLVLADFHMKLVSSSEQLMISAHVRKCIQCRSDLAQIAAEISSAADEHGTLADRVVAVLADMLRMPNAAFGGVRDPEAEQLLSWPRVYTCPQMEVFISLNQGEKAGYYTVQGLLTGSGGDTLPDMGVLLNGHHAHFETRTDDLGNFAFGDVAAGEYTLTIVADGVTVDIEAFAIGLTG